MRKFLNRTATTVAVTAVLLGGTLLTAPAANAATHKIDGNLKHSSISFKVGGHRDVIRLDAIGKASKTVKLNDETYHYAAKYEVTLKHGKHVLYKKVATTYRALLSSTALLVSKHSTDAAAKALVKLSVSLPEREAKAGVQATSEQVTNEVAGLMAAADALEDAGRWVQNHPEATSFDGYVLPEIDAHVGEGLGVDVKLVGTPAAYRVEATVQANGAVLSIDSKFKIRYSKLSLYGQLVKNAPR